MVWWIEGCIRTSENGYVIYKDEGVTQQTIDERRVQVVKNPSSIPLGGELGWRESPWQFGIPWACSDWSPRFFDGKDTNTSSAWLPWLPGFIARGISSFGSATSYPSPLSVFVSYPAIGRVRPCVVFSPSMRVDPLTLPTVVMDRSIYTQVPWRNQQTRMHMLCHYHLCKGMFPFMGMPRTNFDLQNAPPK